MLTDIEIAQQTELRPIEEVAARIGISAEHLETYGKTKAKLSLAFLKKLRESATGKPGAKPEGRLILVTAISPTPPGEGKTTTSVGLADALNRIGRDTIVCLREPSMGPVFGMKGGAAGGGRAQVVPMEDINLHFTGDFAAITQAHNLLSAMIDNHIHQGNALDIDPRRITWRRVLDMNDRALREMTIGLGGPANGFVREDGFDAVAASEVMAILCLARSMGDLKTRLGNIVIGSNRAQEPVRARELGAQGAMAAILRDAFKPNLVQTLEGNPALIHGGPFANIAHGCNSLVATSAALRLSDFVVTEAGFGADLGAEKFIDIKCRKSGLRPSVVVLVATVRALKFHGGADLPSLTVEDLGALERGFANLERHIANVQERFGLPCLVALNQFASDTAAETALVARKCAEQGVRTVVCRHWAEGGAGAEELAREVARIADDRVAGCRFVYSDADTLWEKIRKIATQVYGAADIVADRKVRAQLEKFQKAGFGSFPVCIAKTQYSFSVDPDLRGAPSGHLLNVREVRLSAGAELVVAICGDIMTMPGLPKSPAALRIDVDESGRITGLF